MTTVKTLSELDGYPHVDIFPNSEPRTVRLTLDAGESVPAHTHPGREIVLYLQEGTLEIAIGDETHHLTAGDVARFSGNQDIAPRAEVDSTALIVLATEYSE